MLYTYSIEVTSMETKRDRFVRLAELRVNRIMKDLQLIGNLSNKGNYEYTKNDIQTIFTTIKKELAIVETRFATNNVQKNFKLK